MCDLAVLGALCCCTGEIYVKSRHMRIICTDKFTNHFIEGLVNVSFFLQNTLEFLAYIRLDRLLMKRGLDAADELRLGKWCKVFDTYVQLPHAAWAIFTDRLQMSWEGYEIDDQIVCWVQTQLDVTTRTFSWNFA